MLQSRRSASPHGSKDAPASLSPGLGPPMRRPVLLSQRYTVYLALACPFWLLDGLVEPMRVDDLVG